MVFLHSDFFLKIRRKSAKFRGHADCQIFALLKRVIFSLCLVVPIFARACPARPGMDNSPINRSRCKRGPAERNCDKTGLCRKIMVRCFFPGSPTFRVGPGYCRRCLRDFCNLSPSGATESRPVLQRRLLCRGTISGRFFLIPPLTEKLYDLKGGLQASPLNGGRLKHSFAGITTCFPIILKGYFGSAFVSPQGTLYIAW